MKIYLTGGYLRHHFLDAESSSDLDFAIEAESYEAMRDALLGRGLHIWQERPEYVTLRGRMPRNSFGDFGGILPVMNPWEIAWVNADFTLCRAETMYSDNRHPDTVTPADILTDLSRRDFTINAIAVDEDGQIFDPYIGIHDARNRFLRAVGNPNDRFFEDPLRMLRAIRFSAQHDLLIAGETKSAINYMSGTHLLGTLPVERVREELTKAMKSNWLRTMTMLTYDFPILGNKLVEQFPNLWFKGTTEER